MLTGLTPENFHRVVKPGVLKLRTLTIGRTPVLEGELKRSWSDVEQISTGFTFGTKERIQGSGKKYSAAGGKLTKQAQYWILSKVLGMLPHEIANLYGVNRKVVNKGIGRVSKKISEKELIELFEIPPKSKSA